MPNKTPPPTPQKLSEAPREMVAGAPRESDGYMLKAILHNFGLCLMLATTQSFLFFLTMGLFLNLSFGFIPERIAVALYSLAVILSVIRLLVVANEK